MHRVLVAGLILAAVIGCDDKKASSPKAASSNSSPLGFAVDGQKKEGGPAAPVKGGAAGSNVQRKVIQSATLDVLVKDFDDARLQFAKLIEEHKGYIAKSDFQGNVGSKRSATWVVRVPAETFQAFVDATAALGQPIRHTTQADDVTEEFVDAEAMVKNLKEEELALNKLLQEKAQTLTDIATWKEKVDERRREINRLEARLQTLGRLTALSTANVTIRDEKEYIPPTEPAYGSSVGGTFSESIQSLKQFGKWVLIVLVALAPWLVVASPLAIVIWVLRRRAKRTSGSVMPPLPTA